MIFNFEQLKWGAVLIFIMLFCTPVLAQQNEIINENNGKTTTQNQQDLQVEDLAIPDKGQLFVPTSGLEALSRAKVLYEYGQYPEMVDLLNTGLEKATFSEDQLEDVHRMLGVGYYIVNNRPKSSEHFLRMLTKNPDAELDPAYVPPAIIKHFETIKRENRSLLEMIKAQRSDSPTKTKFERIHNPYFVNFIPFGAGQFQNREPTKGALFLSGQILALGINVTAYFVSLNLESKDGYYSTGNSARAKEWQIVQYTSLGVFVALMIGGIIDAAVNHEPFTFVAVEPEATEDQIINEPLNQNVNN